MCFSANPPFYEGIATFGNFTYTDDTGGLSWNTMELTVTEVSGVGSCLRGKNIIPPQQLLEICNNTIIVDSQKNPYL